MTKNAGFDELIFKTKAFLKIFCNYIWHHLEKNVLGNIKEEIQETIYEEIQEENILRQENLALIGAVENH
jgi:hypothetical protein